MKNIKHCPFCGCNDHRVGIRKKEYKGNTSYRVVCGNCGASGTSVVVKVWHDSKMIAQSQAIAKWNERV